MKGNKVKKMTVLSLLAAMAVGIHCLESLFPSIVPSLPGAKLGLANIFSVVALIRFGYGMGIGVLIVRVLLATLIGGSVLSSFYAFGGGIVSYGAMSLLFFFGKKNFSLMGISVCGAFFHNMGQILVATWILGNSFVWAYFPYLALVSLPTGLFTGAAAHFSLKMIDRAGIPL